MDLARRNSRRHRRSQAARRGALRPERGRAAPRRRAARPGTLGPQSELRCAGEHPPLEVARRRGGRPSLVRPWCERISTPACLYGPSEREKDRVRGGEVVFRTTHVLTRFLRAGVIYCTHWLVGTWSPHGTTTHGFSYAPLYCAHFAHLFGQPGYSLVVHHERPLELGIPRSSS